MLDKFPKTKLLFTAILGVIAIYQICLGLRDEVFWQVVMGASVNWFILLAMFFQSHISQKQWKTTHEALERTDSLLKQNEEMIKASQRQAQAAEDGLTQTRKFFEMAERPFLQVKRVEMSLVDNGVPDIKIIVINHGRTPVINGRIFYKVGPQENVIFPLQPGRHHFLEIPFLAPNDSSRFLYIREDLVSLDSGSLQQIVKDAKNKVFIFGEGTYADLAGNSYLLPKWAFEWIEGIGFILNHFVIENAATFNDVKDDPSLVDFSNIQD